MRKILCAFAAIAGSLSLSAVETTTQVTTSTVTTRTVVSVKEETRVKTRWTPFRICVLDFTSADIMGQKRFLDQRNRPIVIPPQCTLNAADRQSVNDVMQGYVRMIDAVDSSRTNEANRDAQVADNAFDRAKALELYNTVVKGEHRPMVIGAEYLNAYLGRHNDVFVSIDQAQMAAAMQRLQQAPDFPKDFMLRLARETGATHLVYGTVSDMRSKSSSFKGYGIETKSTTYQLDVIVKVVDLVAQHTVYTNVYTGSYREREVDSVTQMNSNIFQSLMTSALEQAAEDLYTVCKPGPTNRVSVTPMPYQLTVRPAGEAGFDPATAEISIDGKLVGRGGVGFTLPAGTYDIEVRAPGYQPKSFRYEHNADKSVDITLEKNINKESTQE